MVSCQSNGKCIEFIYRKPSMNKEKNKTFTPKRVRHHTKDTNISFFGVFTLKQNITITTYNRKIINVELSHIYTNKV